MSSRLLNLSLCLNLVLGVASYWAVKNHSSASTLVSGGDDRAASSSNYTVPPTSAIAPTQAPLHWSELESEDYPTYVANLRKAGCPDPILRRIIGGEIKELYAKKAFALTREFHRNFWQIAARENVHEYFAKTFGEQVKALCNEADALLNQLVGEAPRELSNSQTANAVPSCFTDFLSSSKQEQLRLLADRYELRLQVIRQADLSPDENESQLAQLRRETENEQAQILSPDEFAEYHLRRSIAACEVQHLYGVDFSETELRNMAKAIDDYRRRTDSQTEDVPETLDQKLQQVLGPARFADFSRARSGSFRELYDVASEFDQPAESAAGLFDLRLASEKQSDEIRADKNRSGEEKQSSLDELQEKVEQSFRTKLGAQAYQSYKASNGRWIKSLGRF